MRPFPVVGKKKSEDICAAFIRGARNEGDASIFYGVNETNVHDLIATKAHGRDWFYIDNSYFDKTRGTHFRVTRNAYQCDGTAASDGRRFQKLGIEVKKWRSSGSHIIVCPQSNSFMRNVACYNGSWLFDVLTKLRNSTERKLKIRDWGPDKLNLKQTLEEDMRDAWALVTHSSAAAVSALIAGVPAFAAAGAAAGICGSLDFIEDPALVSDRERLFGVLADNQWTLEEIERGIAWEALNQ